MATGSVDEAGDAPRQQFLGVAAGGLLAWAAGWIWLALPLAEVLLLLGALVCLPLGLALLADEGGLAPLRRRAAALGQLVAGSALLAAFARPPGRPAALLSLPWLLFTAGVAALGVLRLRAAGRGRVEEWCVSAGMIFLAAGGAWTTLSRLGARPLGFGEPIVLLTGVHFHYAGFVLPLLTGLAGRRLPGRLATAAGLGVMVGVPLVAVGITAGRWVPAVEAAAAWILAAAGLLIAGMHLRLAAGPGPAAWRLLLGVAGLALTAGVGLAAAYALGTYRQTYWLSVDAMVLWHGGVNAFGFALPGLLAWHLGRPA
jgi:hypothetical protein